MKITLLGFIGLIALGVLLLYVAKQLHEDHEKGTPSSYPTTDPNPPDSLPGIPDSQ